MAYSAEELRAGARMIASGQKVGSFLEYAVYSAAKQTGPLGSEIRRILGQQ